MLVDPMQQNVRCADVLCKVDRPDTGASSAVQDSFELLGEFDNLEFAIEDEAHGVVQHVESLIA